MLRFFVHENHPKLVVPKSFSYAELIYPSKARKVVMTVVCYKTRIY